MTSNIQTTMRLINNSLEIDCIIHGFHRIMTIPNYDENVMTRGFIRSQMHLFLRNIQPYGEITNQELSVLFQMLTLTYHIEKEKKLLKALQDRFYIKNLRTIIQEADSTTEPEPDS